MKSWLSSERFQIGIENEARQEIMFQLHVIFSNVLLASNRPRVEVEVQLTMSGSLAKLGQYYHCIVFVLLLQKCHIYLTTR